MNKNNEIIYLKLVKELNLFKELFENYIQKLRKNDQEALEKGLYGMLDLKNSMDKVSELYQIIKEDDIYHYQYCQLVKNESITVLNKIHDESELKIMQSLSEKQWLLARTEERLDSQINKKRKL